MFGGTGWPFGQSSGNDFWMMKLSDANKKLEQISNFTGSFPNPNYGHSAFFHDKYFYKIGGTCGYFYNCDIHRYNIIYWSFFDIH